MSGSQQKRNRRKVWKAYAVNKGRRTRGGHVVCNWCQALLVWNQFTVDHVKEKDIGGTHDIENLVPACAKCNGARGRWHIEQKKKKLKGIKK